MKKDEYITITKESYQQMNYLLIERAKHIERLQEQLNDANDIIVSISCMPNFPLNIGLCRDYLKKWGVK